MNTKITLTKKQEGLYPKLASELQGVCVDINKWEEGRSFSDKEVAEYVGVASFRSYPMYLQTKDSTLDLLYLPISEDIIKANRLLEIKDGKVHFRYE